MSETPDLPSRPEAARASRLLRAAAFYFIVVFGVGLIVGPVRVLWLEPWMGPTLAVLCEAPLLIAAMWFAAAAAPRWAGLDGGWSAHLGVGLIALVLQQIADLADFESTLKINKTSLERAQQEYTIQEG